MNTKIGTLSVAALLLAANLHPVQAGDREWATAGKVLTGVIAGGLIARAFEPQPTVVYATPAPTYVVTTVPAPAVVAPAPVVVSAPIVQPAPVVVQAAPAPVVVYQTPPPVVYYAPAPVYVPRPVIGFHIGFGGGYHHHGRHW